MYYGQPCGKCLNVDNVLDATENAFHTSSNHGVQSDVGQAAWNGVKEEIKNLNPEKAVKYEQEL